MERTNLYPPSLRLVTIGGEAVNVATIRRWQEFFKRRCLTPPELLNVYGLTETTIGSLYYDLNHLPEDTHHAYLGSPAEDTVIRIVNNSGHDCSTEEVGELWIGGPAVARGYLSAGKGLDEKFVSYDNVRFYRTGDLFMREVSGELIFLGRTDDQVKLHGYRIEISEVEEACLTQLDIDGCVVVPVKRDGRVSTLACVMVPKTIESNAPVDTLTPVSSQRSSAAVEKLGKVLPWYMIPTTYFDILRLPCSNTDKLDRKNLQKQLSCLNQAPVMAAADPLSTLRDIVSDILGIYQLDDDESLFHAGSDSLGIVRLLIEIEARFGVNIGLDQIIESPTLNGIAVLIKNNKAAAGVISKTSDININSADVTAICPQGRKRPLFWVGKTPSPAHLFNHAFNSNRTVYCFHHQGVNGHKIEHTSISDIADFYIQKLKQISPHGPYHLGGFSIGGVIAYEMAQQLMSQGDAISGLFLISPSNYKMGTSTSNCDPNAYSHTMIMRHINRISTLTPKQQFAYITNKISLIPAYLGNKLASVGRKLETALYSYRGKQLPARLVWDNLLIIYENAMNQYQPKPYTGRLTVVDDSQIDSHAWLTLADTLTSRYHHFDCGHLQLLQSGHAEKWLALIHQQLEQYIDY